MPKQSTVIFGATVNKKFLERRGPRKSLITHKGWAIPSQRQPTIGTIKGKRDDSLRGGSGALAIEGTIWQLILASQKYRAANR